MFQTKDMSYYNFSAVTAQKPPDSVLMYFYKTLSPFQDTAVPINFLSSPSSYVTIILNLLTANAAEVPLHSLPDAEPI